LHKVINLGIFMFRQCVNVLSSLTILLISVSCSQPETPTSSSTPISNPTATPTTTETIVLGDISADEPIKKIERFQPLADYLAANLAEFGIGIGAVKIAPDIKTMTKLMASGEVDIYFDSPYPVMIVSDRSGAQPILRRWKEGDSEYDTVFFARADSGINSLADLQGQIIGLEEEYSTSGYLIPLGYLLKQNLNPVKKEIETSTVTANEDGYVLTGDDENTIQWVISGKIVAGAIDNQTFFSDIAEETRKKLVILAETDKVPRQIVLVKPDMNEEMKSAIIDLLINLDETGEGKKLLEHIRTSQFDRFPTEVHLKQIQEYYQLIKNR
jgi:phosphonate transport system substrate-binding protein